EISTMPVSVPHFTIPTFDESWDDPDVPLEFVLEDLLLRGGTSMLFGDMGAGKSTTLRRFVLQAIQGGAFAGRKFMKRCRVLYIPLENSEASIRRHLKTLGMTKEEA